MAPGASEVTVDKNTMFPSEKQSTHGSLCCRAHSREQARGTLVSVLVAVGVGCLTSTSHPGMLLPLGDARPSPETAMIITADEHCSI